MNPSSSLGPRLNAIHELVTKLQQQSPYPYIWDCCCDHGYLGIKILSEDLCRKLIFVDQVAHIIENLESKLAPFCKGTHELITADAGTLIFNAQQRHLVILAGVGCERTIEITDAIERNNPDAHIDYIFCPSTIKNILREHLVSIGFELTFETIAYEKKRYYEIMYATR